MDNLLITVFGQPLDLPPGEEDRFYITKQINDLIKGLDNRQAEFTRGIDLPATRNNLDLVSADRPVNSDQQPTGFTPCEVRIEGYPVLPNATLLVTSQNFRTISCTIFGGNARFFSQLSDDPLSALNLSAYAFDWNFIFGIPQLRNENSGVVTAFNSWYSFRSFELATDQGANEVDMQLDAFDTVFSGFWFYHYTMLEEIFKTLTGLKVDMSLIPEQSKKIAFACPIKLYYNALTLPPGYKATGVEPVDPLTMSTNSTSKLEPTVFDDPGGLWDATNGYYLIPQAGTGNIRLYLTGAVYDDLQDSSNVNINVNETVIYTEVIPAPPSEFGVQGFSFDIRISYNFSAGDRVALGARATNARGNTKLEFTTMIFEVEKEGNNPSLRIDPSDYMPDISQKAFVSNFLNWFNLVPAEIDNVVRLVPFDNILESPPYTKEMASKDFNYINYLPGYAQNNILKYADNDRVVRQDSSGSFQLVHRALNEQGTALELAFSACDDYPGTGAFRVALPQFEYRYQFIDNNKINITLATGAYVTNEANDIRVGDFIRAGGGVQVVRQVINNKRGFVGANSISANQQDWELLSMEDSKDSAIYCAEMVEVSGETYKLSSYGTQGYVTSGNFKAAQFTQGLTFTQLINNYFASTTAMLYQPLVIQAFFNVTTREFFDIVSTTPIHIPSLGLTFYVNKIEQFKRKGLTRVELIRI